MSCELKTGLLGRKLGHSMSPMLHSHMGDGAYRLFEVEPAELERFVIDGDWDAINVTMPYKKDVMKYCAEISDRAREIGAVNVLVRKGDKIYGDNTDYAGFAELSSGIDFKNKKVIVLGSGGASATVCAVCRASGAASVTVISRSGENNYESLPLHSDADVLVNTTPVGMYPDNFSQPADLGIFTRLSAVLDVIYNPLKTMLVLDAEKRGIYARGGLEMLCRQAHEARRIFTGCEPSVTSDSLFTLVSKKLRNIVLIGMPGCGKTTVGKELSKLIEADFYDTDVEIERVFGEAPGQIIKEHGESAFRDAEEKAGAALLSGHGAVIATGGGFVIRESNRKAMRQNGIVVFIDRDISQLEKSGRPLSSSLEKLKSLYNSRIALYREAADITVESASGAYETALRITEAIK